MVIKTILCWHKIDVLTNGIELRIHIEVHATTVNLFFSQRCQKYIQERRQKESSSSAGERANMLEDETRPLSVSPHKTQVQMDQEAQQRPDAWAVLEEEAEAVLQLPGMGEDSE